MKNVLTCLALLLAPHGASASDFFSLGLPRGSGAGSLFAAPQAAPALPYRAPGPRAARESAAVAGYVSVWTQDCPAGACSLPQGSGPARAVKFELGLPATAGEARTKTLVEEFEQAGFGRLGVKLSFYSVCPYGSAEGCPARYFQVQAELSGAADAFCAASLNAADFLPFPVLMCAGNYKPEKRLGITLHRQPF